LAVAIEEVEPEESEERGKDRVDQGGDVGVFVAAATPEAIDPAESELDEDSRVGANVGPGLVRLAARVCDFPLGAIARQFLLVEHWKDGFVEEAGRAGTVSHPHLEADGAAQ